MLILWRQFPSGEQCIWKMLHFAKCWIIWFYFQLQRFDIYIDLHWVHHAGCDVFFEELEKQTVLEEHLSEELTDIQGLLQPLLLRCHQLEWNLGQGDGRIQTSSETLASSLTGKPVNGRSHADSRET